MLLSVIKWVAIFFGCIAAVETFLDHTDNLPKSGALQYFVIAMLAEILIKM